MRKEKLKIEEMEEKTIVRFFKADSGDCFLLQFSNKKCILIDCGYKATYEKELKPVLIELANGGYSISLFVITHFDEDHIGGAITFISENGDASCPQIIPIENIWFNGIHRLILSNNVLRNHLVDKLSKEQEEKYKVLKDQLQRLIGCGEGNISARQAEAFELLCANNNYEINKGSTDGILVTGAVINVGEYLVRCLNPSQEQIELLEGWINKKCIEMLGTRYELDVNHFSEFIQNMLMVKGREDYGASGSWEIALDIPDIDSWIGTSTLARMNDVNRASIVVEIVNDNNKMLFTGDSESEDWINNIQENDYGLVKLSHHGTTKPNLKLIERLDLKSVIISTNGRRNHPEDELLARIIKKGVSDIYFNYDIRQKESVLSLQKKYSFKAHFGETIIWSKS